MKCQMIIPVSSDSDFLFAKLFSVAPSLFFCVLVFPNDAFTDLADGRALACPSRGLGLFLNSSGATGSIAHSLSKDLTPNSCGSCEGTCQPLWIEKTSKNNEKSLNYNLNIIPTLLFYHISTLGVT